MCDAAPLSLSANQRHHSRYKAASRIILRTHGSPASFRVLLSVGSKEHSVPHRQSIRVGLDRRSHDDTHFLSKTLPASSVIRAWPARTHRLWLGMPIIILKPLLRPSSRGWGIPLYFVRMANPIDQPQFNSSLVIRILLNGMAGSFRSQSPVPYSDGSIP
jgi:hypothetical protein